MLVVGIEVRSVRSKSLSFLTFALKDKAGQILKFFFLKKLLNNFLTCNALFFKLISQKHFKLEEKLLQSMFSWITENFGLMCFSLKICLKY